MLFDRFKPIFDATYIVNLFPPLEINKFAFFFVEQMKKVGKDLTFQ